MLTLDDPRWRTLQGGYRRPYDPTPALRRLATAWDDAAAWDELWGELHHQGDIGEASYAAVPVLAELAAQVPERGWNVYALAGTIETERHARRNPPLPGWLEDAYGEAWRRLTDLALTDLRTATDPLVVQAALTVTALGRGATKLGALIGLLDASELDEYLDERLEWSTRYRAEPTRPTLA